MLSAQLFDSLCPVRWLYVVLVCAQRMLQFDPAKRISAENAMKHPYFKDLKLVKKPEPGTAAHKQDA